MRYELETLESRLLLDANPLGNLNIVERGLEIEPNDTIDSASPLTEFHLGMPCRLAPDGVAICPPNVFGGNGTLGGATAPTDADVDFFSFSANAGGIISLHITGPAVEHGATIELVAADGSVLGTAEAHDTDGDGTPETASLEHVAVESGDYYVRVSSDGDVPANGLDYQIGASVRLDTHSEHEPNDSFDTANDIPLTWYQPATEGQPADGPTLWRPSDAFGIVSGNLESHLGSGGIDYFRFFAWPSLSIHVGVTGDAATEAHLAVYDIHQNVVAESDPAADGTLGLDFEGKYDGPYFVSLSGSGVEIDGWSYELRIDERHPDPFVEHEPNNSFDTANDISLTWYTPDVTGLPDWPPIWPTPDAFGFIRGTLDDARPAAEINCLLGIGAPCPNAFAFVADTDFFRFMAWPGLSIDVRATGAGAQGGHLTIYDKEHNVIAEADPNDAGELALKFDGSYDGPYFAQLTDKGNVVCITTPCLTYALEINEVHPFVDPYAEVEPNDSLKEANPMQQVWLPCCFIALADDLTLVRGNGAAVADTGAVVELPAMEPGQPDIPFVNMDSGAVQTFDPATGDMIDAGVNLASGAGLQDLRLSANAAPDVICLAIGCGGGWWFDRPVTYFARGDLSTPTDGADEDFYSFWAGENRQLEVSYDGVAAGDIELLDADGNVIAKSSSTVADDPADNPNEALLNFFTTVGGQFYVHVSRSADGAPSRASNYDLQVVATHEAHIEHEPNDSLDTANNIELRGPWWFPCDWVCPLATIDVTTASSTTTETVAVDSLSLRPIWWGGDRSLTGYIEGSIEERYCPPEADCLAFIPGRDFFFAEIPAGYAFSVELSGPFESAGALLSLYDDAGNLLASDSDASNGIALRWQSEQGGRFYVSVGANLSDPGLQEAVCFDTPQRSPLCALPIDYRLDITARPATNPIEGRDETEPNNSFEQANTLDLHVFPTFAPGLELRGGDARGIAGGPTADVDNFRFDIHAGEHVTVDVQGLLFDGTNSSVIDTWLSDHHLNQFGDALDTVYAGGTPLFSEVAGHAISRFGYIFAHHPELQLGNVQVTVYDAAGNPIGTSQSGDHGVVNFDAASDGTYFAVVSAAASAAADSPVHYRLGVVARGDFVPPTGCDVADPNCDPNNPVEPKTIVLAPGKSFAFTDSSGDAVTVYFRGGTGRATIHFTGANADGSDIASVNLDGVRRGGNFSIQTTGTAEVGSLEIHGAGGLARKRGGPRGGGFGNVRVDGNVGMVASDMNLRTLLVDGMLGDLSAPTRTIGMLHAAMFDRALADVGHIGTLIIDEDSATALFDSFLPWRDEQP